MYSREISSIKKMAYVTDHLQRIEWWQRLLAESEEKVQFISKAFIPGAKPLSTEVPKYHRCQIANQNTEKENHVLSFGIETQNGIRVS